MDAGQGGRRDLLEVPGDGPDAELGLEEGEERVRALAVDLDLAEERKLGLHAQPPMSSCSPARHPWFASITWYFSVTNCFISAFEPGSCHGPSQATN
jgi:hypothetical protein